MRTAGGRTPSAVAMRPPGGLSRSLIFNDKRLEHHRSRLADARRGVGTRRSIDQTDDCEPPEMLDERSGVTGFNVTFFLSLLSCPAETTAPGAALKILATLVLLALPLAAGAQMSTLAAPLNPPLAADGEGARAKTTPPQFQHLRVLPIGDSMTAGGDDYPSLFRSYRGSLYHLLRAQGHDIDFIGPNHLLPIGGGDPDHAAFGGALIGPDRNANNAFDRLDPILAGVGEVDVVIVAMGWNSVFNEPADAARKYEGLVNRLKSMRPKATLVLATLSPPRGQSEKEAEAGSRGYRELNAKARHMASRSQTDRLLLADLARAPFSKDDFWDVIHWHQSGADKAARVIFRTLIDNAAIVSAEH